MNIDTLEKTINKQAEDPCPWCTSELEIIRDKNAYILGCTHCDFEAEIDVLDLIQDWRKKHPKWNLPNFNKKLTPARSAYYLWGLSFSNTFEIFMGAHNQEYSEKGVLYWAIKFQSEKEAEEHGELLKGKGIFKQVHVGGFCTIPLYDCPCCDDDDSECRLCDGKGKIWLDLEGRIIPKQVVC